MARLLRAGARRYLKSAVFYIGLLAAFLGGMYVGTLENPDPNCHLILAAAVVVVMTLQIGREYSDGGFRNKLIAGHKKGTVFWSEGLLSAAVLLVYLIAYCGGFLLTGATAYAETPTAVLLLCAAAAGVCGLCFLCVGFFFSMLISNKAVAAVVNLLLIVALSVPVYTMAVALMPEATYTTYEMQEKDGKAELVAVEVENPNYVGGVRRKVYTAAVQVSPFGQGIEQWTLQKIYRAAKTYDKDSPYASDAFLEEQRKETAFTPQYALALAGILLAAGCAGFCKKDMK